MNENYLLNTPLSQWLFHECVKDLPIIDYHNHLNVGALIRGKRFQNIADLWLLCDPYKHRAMRICGISERFITGNAEAVDKFRAWMSVLPRLIGNPLYDWSVLEMKRIFDIDLVPEIAEADQDWKQTYAMSREKGYTHLSLLSEFHVEYAAPCMEITEEVSMFAGLDHLVPSMRGDSVVNVSARTIEELEEMTGMPVETLEDYFRAISIRLEEFEKAGCRFADHALDDGFLYFPKDGKCGELFGRVRRGEDLDDTENKRLSSEILRFLAGEYGRRGWMMQLHIGAQRYTSSRLRMLTGSSGGYAGIGNCCSVRDLTRMLDDFERGKYGLPRILLFPMNPADNAVMSALSGSYSEDGVPGKVQQGPAWWWCDHLYGMRETFENISSFGVLSVFIGMTTDSRSILSFVRHEYFRRALCGWIGSKVESGEISASREMLRKLVTDISYFNARKLIEER